VAERLHVWQQVVLGDRLRRTGRHVDHIDVRCQLNLLRSVVVGPPRVDLDLMPPVGKGQ
jgi:hypothetical protein